ncbi:uncharacterized protein LOC142576305 isoform X2 [Dermacentor variabilis]|uniref:uncharacterized protein LOC142576305 isoform X2 n=1 Tax=Dermacentor variabilis TaxID=34621 RepID=UPI003F5AF183
MYLTFAAVYIMISFPSSYAQGCSQTCYKEWCPAIKNPNMNPWILLSTGDPEAEENSCAKLWCPKLRDPCYNKFICSGGHDPELQIKSTQVQQNEEPKEATTIKAPTAEAPSKTRPAPETRPNSGGKTTLAPDYWPGYLFPYFSYNSRDCRDENYTPRRDGAACLVTPLAEEIGGPTNCYVGVCWEGACAAIRRSKCSTM